jgi:hypothetical protein
VNYIGRSNNLVLFATDDLGAVVDETTNMVSSYGLLNELFETGEWNQYGDKPQDISHELANAAMTDLDIRVFADNDRMYTIPDAVVAEAKRGLAWRKEEKRGGTPVGLNTARTLAGGGQIGIKKVRHIAKYFPRHEVDKKGKGYKPGQDGYPSNGRIAWALWGGDAAQRWASAIVERENKKKSSAAIVASHGFDDYNRESRVDHDSFRPSDIEPDFFIRIRLDGSGIDRLYKVDEDGSVCVWDDGSWDDLGNIRHDFLTYDKTLDDPYDKCQKIHTPVDRESALKISAMLDNSPMETIHLHRIEFDETDMFEKAIPELDWQFLDQLSNDTVEEAEDYEDDFGGLLASITEFAEDETPGEYTPEERSEAASSQVRDKLGRFAEVGQRVVIGGDYNYQGNITSINADSQEVGVELDNGNTVTIPGNTVQEISTFEPVSTANFPANNLDFTGILGEPRVPIDQPTAQLPGRLPPLTAPAVNTLVNDWGAWVAEQRLSPEYEGDPIPPKTYKAVPDVNTALGKYYNLGLNPDGTVKKGWNPAFAPNALEMEPDLRDWWEKEGNSNSFRNAKPGGGSRLAPSPVGWYRPKNIQTAKESLEKLGIKASAQKDVELTPETADVPPIYMAIVAEDDPQAVMNLICLIPAGKKTRTPATFVRKQSKWERDDQFARDLASPTPPPVVLLDNETLASVVDQIDGNSSIAASGIPSHYALTNNAIIAAIQAAGGLDRNRGNAEKLRRYWTVGKGGLKIRWNTPGDWTRCNRYLRKYMGPRAKGYCALRHKEMTGVWPGSKYNVGKKKKGIRGSADIESLKSEEKVIGELTLRARAESARSRLIGREGTKPGSYGSKFIIPLVIPEAMESGDGRIFEKGAIEIRDLPLPLLWQIKTGQGHDGSVVVGQITHMERTDQGIGNAYGVFDDGEFGKEAERLVRHGFIRGVSADMDKFEAEEPEIPELADGEEDSKKMGSGRINITNARVMAVTIVPKPAFQECFIQLIDKEDKTQEGDVAVPDGIYVEGVNPLDASALVACGMVADAIPMAPPVEWFNDQKLSKATPLTVTDEGQVFGHIAAWHVDHIGMAFGTRPPRSRSKYAYFHTGLLRTAEGDDIPVGQLTLAGGHAGLEASADEAVRHYDDTASAFADVHAGEDAYGIWVAGALRPGTTPEQIRAARASAPSGDWRPIKGHLELVAVCQVNVPGFPIARARVASGQVLALVAAGANVLAQLKHDPLAELSERLDRLENPLVASKHAELAARVKKTKKEDEAEGDWDYMIQMLDDNPENEMAVVSRRTRMRLVKEGKALDDGSFPIRDAGDLKNAVRAYGRAKPGSKGRVRKHIMRRARALRRLDLIPQKWTNTSAEDFGEFISDGAEATIQERAFAVAAVTEFKKFTEEERQALAKKGQALPDGSYPIRNESDLENAISAYGRSNPEDRAKVRTHIRKRARALGKEELIPENWKVASIDDVANDLRLRAELASQSTNLEALFNERALTASATFAEEIEDLTEEEIKALKVERMNRAKKDDGGKYTPQTQPRDTSGKFRKVLARLKSDLGTSGLDRVVEKVVEAENLDDAGNYKDAARAAEDLVGIIDRLDAKALNPEALENVRASSAELGKVIANLPFAFGEQATKIRFSDVPPALQKLMKDMIKRVEEKIGDEDADVATEKLTRFMSGGDYFNQSEISSEMAKLLRLLT